MAIMLALADPVSAAGVTATQLHAQGAWREAIAIGAAQEDVPGLIAAAKAALFLAAFELEDEDEAVALLSDAVTYAQAALERAPDNDDAALQRAIAEGYFARIKTSPRRARKSRKLGERIIERDADNAFALGFLGGWHGESIASYGVAIAKVTVGASKSAFQEYFDAALEAAPNNPLIVAYYARLLLDINDNGMRAKAETLLENIQESEPSDAFEAFMKSRATELMAALQTGDEKTLKRLVKEQRALRNLK
ncbi:MAG: hypothetical protein AAF562_09375 [Pseudomonadota bacterium]